jgi:hypothetical protein
VILRSVFELREEMLGDSEDLVLDAVVRLEAFG